MNIYERAVFYHFVHALGILIVAAVAAEAVYCAARRRCGSAGLLAAGIVLFSGSLYALALTGNRMLGAITPFGGVSFIAAWVVLAITVVRPRSAKALKYASVSRSPSSRFTFGSHPRIRRALEISGCRLRGSSDGSGSWAIFRFAARQAADALREFQNRQLQRIAEVDRQPFLGASKPNQARPPYRRRSRSCASASRRRKP